MLKRACLVVGLMFSTDAVAQNYICEPRHSAGMAQDDVTGEWSATEFKPGKSMVLSKIGEDDADRYKKLF
ncbi:hypothetical protein [Pedomonas mirosovicensis]|uniref:hypothetical protein n=1 Tax=Pedomonas mirosovicensis TaxID=2908641 RepID=UPI002166FED7|nr:hypothetical protein [Pedomonas mirosovicensis]MCH8685372.1 hypothetical protein [Pedomonas mirosovicensis]